jgi:hypothetical protein
MVCTGTFPASTNNELEHSGYFSYIDEHEYFEPMHDSEYDYNDEDSEDFEDGEVPVEDEENPINLCILND